MKIQDKTIEEISDIFEYNESELEKYYNSQEANIADRVNYIIKSYEKREKEFYTAATERCNIAVNDLKNRIIKDIGKKLNKIQRSIGESHRGLATILGAKQYN